MLVLAGLQGTASAVPLSCNKSATTVEQGGSLTVSGTADTAGEFLRAILDRATTPVQVGSGNAAASGAAPFNYSFTVTIPASTDANVTHTLEVTDAGGGGAQNCGNILVTEDGDAADDNGDDDNGDDEEEQETLNDILDAIEALDSATPAPAAPAAPQQQQQQQIVPASFGGGASLPKTGAEVMDLGGVGVALLMVGGSLMRLGRNRVRRFRAERGAVGSTAEAVARDDDFITPSF